MLKISAGRLADEWASLKRNDLKLIALALNGYAETAFGKSFRVTCIYRSEEEEKSVGAKSRTHNTWRAIDVNWEAQDPSKKQEEQSQREAVSEWINSVVARSDGKPVAYSEPHGTGAHIHIQVPHHTFKAEVSGLITNLRFNA